MDNRKLDPESGVTIVVPARDEERGIGPTLGAIQQSLGDLDVPWEIVVVDDGSRDRTAEIAREAGARVICHPKSGGYGRALKTGIRAARYETIGITDADGTYPVDRLPEMLERLTRFDMVIGARTGRYYRRMALLSPMRTAFLLMSGFVTGTWIPDPNSGLRVFRRADVVPLLDRLPNAFSFTTTLTLIMTLDARFIDYYAVPYMKRLGRSKVRVVRDALRVGQGLVETTLRHNPLKMFMIVAALPFMAAVVLGAFAPMWPTLVTSAVVAWLTSLLIFAVGMLAVVVLDRSRKP